MEVSRYAAGIIAVDPPACGCTECLTGEYVPLEFARPDQLISLLTGAVANNTGLRFAVTQGPNPETVHVSPLHAEDGTPVADNAPGNPAWQAVAAGWDLDLSLFSGRRLDPGAAYADSPPAWTARQRYGHAVTPAVARVISSALADVVAGESPAATGGCGCPGRTQGKHDLLCEHGLRGAFGSVGEAPEDVKQMLRARNRLVPGTVVTAAETEPGAPADPGRASSPEAGPASAPAGARRSRRPPAALGARPGQNPERPRTN